MYAPSFQFPWNPDPLVPGNDYKIYDEMLQDDQVKAVLHLKKSFVISSGWQIVCDDPEKAEWITDALKNINEGSDKETSIDEIFYDILSCYEYGFSLSERIFGLNDEMRYVYKDIKTRPPHSFRFEIDEKGTIMKVIQSTARGELAFNPQLFLHHIYQPTFGNPYGRSDLYAAYNPWKAKKFVDRFYAVYLESFAGPTVVGRYPKNSDPNEIARFHEMLKTIQNRTVIAMPDGTVVDFVMAQRDSSDAYKTAVDHYDTRIARAVLVPDLMGMSGGETEGGSFSLGKKHFEIFLGNIQKDRESLQRKITNKIVRPLVDLNFGKEYKARFEFIQYKDEDRINLARLWVDAVKGKMFDANDEEIQHLRKLTGFPEGEIIRPAPPTEFDPDGNPIEKPNPHDPENKNKMGAPTAYMPGGKKKETPEKEKEKINTFREMTMYEKKVNFGGIERVLEDRDTRAVRQLTKAGQTIFDDLLDQIREKGMLRRFKPEQINTLQVRHQKQMNATLKSHLKDLFMESYEDARREIIPSGAKRFAETLVAEDFLRVLESESFKVVGDYTNEITKKAKNLLVDGIKNGTSEGALIKVLREEFDTATDRWLNTVVRTKNTEIYNQGRRAYWEQDEIAKEIVTAYQYSAIMDDRTSEVCSALDGKIFEIGEDVSRVTPPLHFNCRSLLVPVTKFEDYSAAKIPTVAWIQDRGGNLKNF